MLKKILMLSFLCSLAISASYASNDKEMKKSKIGSSVIGQMDDSCVSCESISGKREVKSNFEDKCINSKGENVPCDALKAKGKSGTRK